MADFGRKSKTEGVDSIKIHLICLFHYGSVVTGVRSFSANSEPMGDTFIPGSGSTFFYRGTWKSNVDDQSINITVSGDWDTTTDNTKIFERKNVNLLSTVALHRYY